MQGYFKRALSEKIENSIKNYKVTAILGPRQCGKSTLIKEIVKRSDNFLYLDLERPSDYRKLENPELYFQTQSSKTICLDEIQWHPNLFRVLRSVVDEQERAGQFVILGSASRDLIQHSSETLAGRINLIELTPFLFNEDAIKDINRHWLLGGFPQSYLAQSNDISFEWRLNFIKTFLERDIPQLGFKIPVKQIERLWRMLAHNQSQLLNQSDLGNSLGVSHTTIKKYTDLLEQTFMIRSLPPYLSNEKKRLVKSPKIYLRDTGVLHALLGLESIDDLMGHPILGASWKGYALEQILANTKKWQAFHYRTSSKNEVDLVLEKAGKHIVIEFKVSKAPKVTKGFWKILEDLKPQRSFIVAPINEGYPLKENVFVATISEVLDWIDSA